MGAAGEKGTRCESVTIPVAVYLRMILYSSVKAGHWETEKAEYKTDGDSPIEDESEDLLWTVPYGNGFLACKMPYFLRAQNVITTGKVSRGNLSKEGYRGFFI